MSEYIYERSAGRQHRKEEITRCRDCKHFEEIEGRFKWCSFHNMDVEEHDFCSKGGRREQC